jgi:phosphatidylglycerol:prolipoprotein diacylglycerol transferase
VFAWLWRLRDHHHATGWRFGVYLVLAGTERFLIEIVRAKDDRLLGPLTLAQVTSVLLILVGSWLMVRLREREPALTPAALPPALKPLPRVGATP